MTAWLTAACVAIIVLVVVLAALIGWGERVTRWQRNGLLLMSAGLIWAAPARFWGYDAGLPDLMFLAGLALYLVARHAKHILHRADALDGIEDGRVRWPRRT